VRQEQRNLIRAQSAVRRYRLCQQRRRRGRRSPWIKWARHPFGCGL